jgi:beta-N-acetylhexosaminidase
MMESRNRTDDGMTVERLTLIALVVGIVLSVAACGSTKHKVGPGLSTMPTTARPTLEGLSLDEKIGQLFVYGAHGVFMNEESPAYRHLLHEVRENHIGGIIWFVSNVYETALLNRHLQDAAKIPLLVSADLEAGIGMRLLDTTMWPWAMAVAATGDPSLAEREGKAVAQEARALGINQIFAPVADVNNNPDNPVINARSFGEDPATVARFVEAFIEGVQSENVIATAKHFPGHGDTRTDSHRSLPVLEVSRERLDRIELVPFRRAIAAGVKSIMMAHLAIPQLDPTAVPVREKKDGDNPYVKGLDEVAQHATLPATISRIMIEGLLRKELGFQGLVITDAFDMGGVTDHFDPGEAAVRAIEAGEDQVLMSPDTDAAIRAVKEAVVTGRLPMARIDQSVARILDAKAFAGSDVASPEALFRLLDSPGHRALAEEIAQKAVTLLREESVPLPLRRDARVVEVVVSEFPELASPLPELDHELRARLTTPPRQFVLDARSTKEETVPLLDAIRDADIVVYALAIRARSGSGKLAIPTLALQLIEDSERMKARAVAVSFGTPYLVRDLPRSMTYLAAYGIQPVMQMAVARALFGEAPMTGKLPVGVPGFFALGDGISKAMSNASR